MRTDMEMLSSCKAYIGVEVLLHAFLISALRAADWTVSYPSRFIPICTVASVTKLFPLGRQLHPSHANPTYLPTRVGRHTHTHTFYTCVSHPSVQSHCPA